MSYRDRIAKITGPGPDPRHVEAWMRLKLSTLDSLSPGEFRREVQEALQVMAAAQPGQSEKLALSYGLRAPAIVFISPPPRVRVNPNTYKWRCPQCKRLNDDGDTTCLGCGQDVELKGA